MASRARGVAVAAATVAATFLVPPARAAAVPSPTTLQVNIRDGVRRAGQPAGVVGHLLRGPNEPVAGEPVTLWTRDDDGEAWTLADATTTDEQGGATFVVTPERTTWYQLRHAETAAAAASTGTAVVAVTAARTAPAPPERVAADRGDAAIRVSWLPPPDDGGSPVTGYTVRVATGGRTTAVERPAGARTAVVGGLANDQPYTVSVTARTALGSATRRRDGWVTPRDGAPAPPAGGTSVCGRLPLGVTSWTAAGSPYVVCPAGVVVPLGATLDVEGAEVRFRGLSALEFEEPYGLEVRGGTLRVAGSTLRGERGRRGEWRGIVTDLTLEDASSVHSPTGSAVALTGSTVRDAVDPVRLTTALAHAGLTDTVLSDASGTGLRSAAAVRATRLTVRDVAGRGVDVACGLADRWYPPVQPCPVVLSDVTVRRAAGRGVSVETQDRVSVHGTVVTASGTAAPRSEAARFSGMTAAVGADIGDVTGGGNGVDAVVLDLTATADLTWRTPVARTAAAPGPLGYVVRNLVMADGKSITFPAGSVVKGVPAPFDCRTTYYERERRPCVAGIEVTNGALDASAPGTVFTGAADPGAGLVMCPSALAPACGAAGPWWSGLSTGGNDGRVTLTGATVRRAAVGLYVGRYWQAPGVAATVSGTTFDRNSHAVHAQGGDGAGHPLTITGSTVLDSPRGVEAKDIGVAVTDLTVRRSGGVVVTGGWGGCGSTPDAVSVSGLTVEDAPGPGLELTGLCHPSVRAVTVRRSGLPKAGEAIGRPAVVMSNALATYGPGRDVDGLAGGGNGIDAVALGGTATGDLTWLSPSNATADHPLGYVLAPQFGVSGTGTVTLPAGALVAGLDGAGMMLRGASLDASAGGARFVSVYDADLGCRAGCGPRTWGAIQSQGYDGGSPVGPGNVRIAGATVRGADLRFWRDGHFVEGEVRVTGTTSDGALFVREPWHATVTDSTFDRITVLEARDATVERNTVPVADGFIQVSGVGDTAPVVLRDNHVAAGTAAPAYAVGDAAVTLGPGGGVDGNTGAGGNAVLLLTGVTTGADVDWVTPTADPEPHPVGYAVLSYEPFPAAYGLTVRGPHALRVPEGGLVQADRLTFEDGAGLDATAGGAVVTAPSDATAGVPVCQWWRGWSGECHDPETAAHGGRTSLRGGRIDVARARLYAHVAVGFPAPAGAGVTIADSYVAGSVTAYGVPVNVTGTTFDRGGVTVRHSTGNAFRDVRIVGGTGQALLLGDAPADVREVEVTGTAAAGEWDPKGAVLVGGNSTGSTFGCLDVRGNAHGFAAAGTPVTVTDSTLDGNGGYDLDNTIGVTTSGVWWGQPGGPAPGQVRDPAKHTDTAPVAAAPPCAKAETAAPPRPPRAVGATGADHALSVWWQPPLSDGGSPVTGYRVTALPGGATVTTGPDVRGTKVPGLTPGRTYVATVTALTDLAPSAPSRPSPPARPQDTAAVATALTASAPALVAYGGSAVVTGRLTTAAGGLASRTVELHVRRVGDLRWDPPIALRTSASGTVSYTLRPKASSYVRLGYLGDAGTKPSASPVRTVKVRPVITAYLDRAAEPYGTAGTLTGRVTPELPAHRVRLERLTRDGWQTATGAYLSNTGDYRFALRPPGRGTFSYRVVYDATTAYARGVSPVREFTVT